MLRLVLGPFSIQFYMNLPFYILDVFAQNKYEGNQLAVFCNAQDLSAVQMQVIAREINFAESTFILSDAPINGGYDVRIFTPDTELPFAGHPTIGTSWLILNKIAPGNNVKLNLKVGQIPVVKHPDGALWLTAAQPTFKETPFSSAALASFSGILPAQITEFGHVSTGVPCLVIYVESVATLAQLNFNVEAAMQFFVDNALYKTNSPDGISSQLYWVAATSENSFQTRMFCWENNRLIEDPATGSAASCLLAYLLKNKSPVVEAHIRQGVEMGRNARIYLKGQRTDTHYQINVGGHVAQIATGVWEV